MKAIALISGGLDSILAARLIKDQGITIIPLNFYLPFYNLRKDNSSKTIASFVRLTLGQNLNTVDISRQFLKILENPKYGYGSNMNPCIDCKILMLSEAKELLKELGAEFIVTGEVLGQRPMSQHRQALELIEKRSGLKGVLLRPLSAKHLPQTLPEKEGWVDRNKLLSFSGRTRKPQIELAKVFKIEDYPNPAGGCLLTDPEFSKRLKDVISRKELTIRNIELLKFGRHFRISQDSRLVVGRNEKENGQLLNLARNHDYIFTPKDSAGPTCLGIGEFNDELIKLSCGIASRYCDRSVDTLIKISYRRIPADKDTILEACPLPDSKIISYRI